MLLALKLGLCLPENIIPQGLQMPTYTMKEYRGVTVANQKLQWLESTNPIQRLEPIFGSSEMSAHRHGKTGIVKSADFSRKERTVAKLYINSPNFRW